jgi:hypothetical protein
MPSRHQSACNFLLWRALFPSPHLVALAFAKEPDMFGIVRVCVWWAVAVGLAIILSTKGYHSHHPSDMLVKTCFGLLVICVLGFGISILVLWQLGDFRPVSAGVQCPKLDIASLPGQSMLFIQDA